MAKASPVPSSTLRWSVEDRWVHTGGGNYVAVTEGDVVPDGFDLSILGPLWVAVPDETPVSVVVIETEEV